MGSLLSSIWGKLFSSDKSYNILIVGLANAGKTTLLYRMYAHQYAGPWARPSRPLPPSAATYSKSRTRTLSSAHGTLAARSGSAPSGPPTTPAPTRWCSSSTAPTPRTRSSPKPSCSRSSLTRYHSPNLEPEERAHPSVGQ